MKQQKSATPRYRHAASRRKPTAQRKGSKLPGMKKGNRTLSVSPGLSVEIIEALAGLTPKDAELWWDEFWARIRRVDGHWIPTQTYVWAGEAHLAVRACSYVYQIGPLLPGHSLRRSCDVPDCVAHLDEVVQ